MQGICVGPEAVQVKGNCKRYKCWWDRIYSETWWNGPWVNRNSVHSDLNFKSPVFSLIIFVKNHWIHWTLHIPNSGLDLRSQYTNYCYNYLRKPVMIRSIKRVFTYMWISIGSKLKGRPRGNVLKVFIEVCILAHL